MKNSRAFTIVEIIVVVSVAAILSAVAVSAFNTTRKESRDATRQGNVTIISEALEKYYEKNGEYPSVAGLVNSQSGNTGAAVASRLSIPVESLLMPQMPKSATNSIISAPEPYDDYVVYAAESNTDNPGCQNDANGGCDSFTLTYQVEKSGEVKVIESRHNSRSSNVAPEITVSPASTTSINASWTNVPGSTSFTLEYSLSADMSAPEISSHTATNAVVTSLTPDTEYFFRVQASLPSGMSSWSEVESATTSSITLPTGVITITAVLSGTNARGTAGGGTCPIGASIERQIRYKVNSDNWQGWASTSPRDVPAIEGSGYTFQAQARCVVGSIGGPWAQSGTQTVTRPVVAPSGLTITATMAGTDARGTATGGTCAAGTTIEREIRYQATSTTTAGSWSGWVAGSPRNVAANQGWRYTFQQQARCAGPSVSSTWSSSDTADVVRSISFTPTKPTVSVSTSGTTSTWSWNAASGCPTGTTAGYQLRNQADWGLDSGWSLTFVATQNSWITSTQGYEYTSNIRALCSTVYVVGPPSSSGAASYIRPVTAPGVATAFSHTIATDRLSRRFAWTAPTCGSGAQAERRYNSYVGSPLVWTATGTSGWLHGASGWSEQGFYTPIATSTSSSGPYPTGADVQVKVQYICVNPTTGRASSWGSVATSPLFKT